MRLRYDTGELLGEGGMGEVYRAFDAVLQRPVALKFLRREDPKLIERLLREARAQAKVEHELVCKVYDVGELDGRHYIAMQLIEGERLDLAAKRMSLEQRVIVVREVAEAVHAAHCVGLVHRDLKPNNILVEWSGPKPKPFVTDFGLARDAQDKSLTLTGEAVGTPPYMAPEQARGELHRIDRRTDVYALGAMLYELLAGRPPFVGKSALQTLFNVVQTEAVPLRTIDKTVPRALEIIVFRCLEKEPQRRYDSARELAEDLGRWVNGEPIQAQAPGIARRLWARVRRNRLASVLALAIAVAVGLWLRAVGGAREQARLAQQFAHEAEAIETTLRVAQMLPVHDIRPEREQVRARMRALEASLALLGSAAEGPGRSALGRGALALHDLGAARLHLEKAWAAGHRAPEVALALGQVLGQQYRDAIDEVESTESQGARKERRAAAERDLRDPALGWLRIGRGAAAGSPREVEAQIATYESRYQDAIGAAQAAQREAPAVYESARLEGDIYTRMAGEGREHGDIDAAIGFAARAAEPYRRATEIGRSDEVSHLGECHRQVMLLTLHADKGQPIEEDAAGAIAACDRALAVNPDSVRALLQKSHLYWRQVEVQSKRGIDPSAAHALAIQLARAALEREPGNQLAHYQLGTAWLVLAHTWQQRQGIDPRPSIRNGIESLERAIAIRPSPSALLQLGGAHATIGEYELAHGGDPLPHWERAVEASQRAIALDPRSALPYNHLGTIFNDRAEWELSQGIDPRPSAERAAQALRKSIELLPSFAYAFNNLGASLHSRAQWERGQGMDCTAAVEEAVQSYRRGLQLMPTYVYGYDNIGDAYRTLALNQLQRGLDPTPTVRAAREALDAGLKLNDKDHYNYVRRARIELVAARLAHRSGAPPEQLEAALAAAVRAAELDQSDADAPEVEAEIRRWQAEWRLARNQPAAEGIELGLAAAARALQRNPKMADALAAQGALKALKARVAPSAEVRAALAVESGAALQKARAMNPLLARDYPP